MQAKHDEEVLVKAWNIHMLPGKITVEMVH